MSVSFFTRRSAAFLSLTALAMPWGHAAKAQDAMPQFTLAYFNSDCPAGWAPQTAASGRFLLPSMQGGGSGVSGGKLPLTPGKTPTHSHKDATASIDIPAVEYVGIDGCCNDSLGHEGDYTMTGSTESASGGIPFVQYMVCLKTDGPASGTVPEDVMTHHILPSCPAGWSANETAAGRYVLGLPTDGAPGVTFGGKTMGTGEVRTHTHSIANSIDLPGQHVALASGCCAHDYASAGSTKFYGKTVVASPPVNPPPNPQPADSAVRAPYYTAPLCVKQ